MKAFLFLGLLGLTACGVDGPPERPQGPQRGLSGTYTDENGVMRTPGKTLSVGGTVVAPAFVSRAGPRDAGIAGGAGATGLMGATGLTGAAGLTGVAGGADL